MLMKMVKISQSEEGAVWLIQYILFDQELEVSKGSKTSGLHIALMAPCTRAV